jgi:hypothetical protein
MLKKVWKLELENFNKIYIYTQKMGVYDATMKAIVTGKKNNLEEKMMGSNKYEFKKVCELLESKYGTKSSNLMGLGTSCIVYNYGSEVIKVCAKKIKFFHDRKDKSANCLKKVADPMSKVLLPVKKVIYDGDEFFAYIQDKCEPLPKKTPISAENLNDILHIVEVMFSNGILVGQIKPKNVGFYKGHIVLFDYHSMHILKDRIKDKPDWYHSLEESLQCYQGLYKHSDKVKLSSLIEAIVKIKSPQDTTKVVEMINGTRRQLSTKKH